MYVFCKWSLPCGTLLAFRVIWTIFVLMYQGIFGLRIFGLREAQRVRCSAVFHLTVLPSLLI